ncbi:hypothetical protein [Nonomuraea diastatica]|uniref:HTH araC/xylS-type domain-containing protein n=1 Tax=Nonomuraea diastatica TaxID=1848329 RepID=A0A4R4X000_9ACTN|nr:hypothetical protein [Nonomuraea diastatica]TDD23375.1 hypothetical protein E1294_08905 [Nonomuraea diastatica]
MELALVAIPKALLPLREGVMDKVLGRAMPVEGGVSGLLKRFIEDLSDEKLSLRPAARVGAGGSGDGVLRQNRRISTGPTAGGRQALTLRLRASVLRHLHDPELSPRSVAAAHHISVSHLHRLFQEDGDTVAAWIRDQRLQRARSDPRRATNGRVCEHRPLPHPQAPTGPPRLASALLAADSFLNPRFCRCSQHCNNSNLEP